MSLEKDRLVRFMDMVISPFVALYAASVHIKESGVGAVVSLVFKISEITSFV